MCVCIFLLTAVSSEPRTFSRTKLELNKYVSNDCEERVLIINNCFMQSNISLHLSRDGNKGMHAAIPCITYQWQKPLNYLRTPSELECSYSNPFQLSVLVSHLQIIVVGIWKRTCLPMCLKI